MLVLLAEDSDVVRESIAALLTGLGHTVHSVTNGWHAALSTYGTSYDIVFMDVSMPVMDGWDATNLIREYEEEHGWRHVPIVAITAIFGRDDAMSAGMDDYISKPVTADKIGRTIRQWCQPASVSIDAATETKSINTQIQL